MEGGGGGLGGEPGLLQQILSLRLVPRVGNVTDCQRATLCSFPALFTLRHHKYGRFMSVGIFLMGVLGPISAGILTSAAIAGVYKAAGKEMIPFEALVLGVGQTFCVLIVSFLRILATL
ncbi:transmembrane protein 170A isoform X1 [Xenopus laevis]|uniref:Transmembrane protein 170A n=1 Tax=Xenopus laevis TaxID=8355 RepID=A0A8J0UZW2_XENLA|nr:transmembrane protein 170A isoform X1 [Xenopus laevis]